MAVSTNTANLTRDAWTELADGSASVSIMGIGVTRIRVHVGTTSPDLDSAAFVPGASGGSIDFNGLETGDKVFARAEYEPVTIVYVKS